MLIITYLNSTIGGFWIFLFKIYLNVITYILQKFINIYDIYYKKKIFLLIKRNFPISFYLDLERFDDVEIKADMVSEKF